MLEPNSMGVSTYGRSGAFAMLLMLALLVITAAGCSPQSMAQSATATATAQPSTANTPPALSATSRVLAVPTIIASPSVSSTLTVNGAVTSTTVPGTPTVRPTPTGTPPDPISVLNMANSFNPFDVNVVRRDIVPLDGSSGPGNVMFTTSSISLAITEELRSAINVLIYDPKYREWNLAWQSVEIPGKASPLPIYSQPGGYNGGDLVHKGVPVLALRTTTLDGRAHLILWSWNRQSHAGESLQMAPTGGGATRAASFDADLDVNMADLDNDGIYEVVVDNVGGAQVWKWDSNKYVQQGGR